MQDSTGHRDMSVREFQRLYLDEQMHHSSGWFSGTTVSLEAAQDHKSKRLATVLDIQPGMELLDVGCSWGAFARWMARQGAVVTGITVDPEHAVWAPRIPGLNIIVRRWQDYSGVVDRVVCINALENFDERPRFFQSLHSWLRPGGRAILWSVTADSPIYRPPSVSEIRKWAADAQLEVLWLTTGLGHHYARTLACFASNLEAARIPHEYRIAHEWRNWRLRFYNASRRLLETGRNDMIEVALRRMN